MTSAISAPESRGCPFGHGAAPQARNKTNDTPKTSPKATAQKALEVTSDGFSLTSLVGLDSIVSRSKSFISDIAERAASIGASPKGIPSVSIFEVPRLIAIMKESAIDFVEAATEGSDAKAVHVPAGHMSLPGIDQIAPIRSIVAVKDPSLAKEILKSPHFSRGFEYEEVGRVLGESLLTIEGEKHRAIRKALSKSFTPKSVMPMRATMQKEVAKAKTSWDFHAKRGRPFDARLDLQLISLNVVCRGMFSTNLTLREMNEIESALHVTESIGYDQMFQPAFMKSLPTPSNLQFKSEVDFLHRIADKILDKRYGDNNPPQDLLADMINARVATEPHAEGATQNEDGDWARPLSRSELRDEIVDILLAGHATTASTMSFMVDLLARNPKAQALLHKALDEAPDEVQTGRADSPIVQAIWSEALRLYPAAVMTPRHATEDTVIDGIEFPKGTFAMIVPYVSHRDTNYWDNPESFEPERFLDRSTEARKRRSDGYLPFGHGAHACIGRHIATMEALTVLTELVGQFEIEAHSPPAEVAGGIIARPKGPVKISLKPRA